MECPFWRHTRRGSQIQFLADLLTDFARRRQTSLVLHDVEVGFVERQRLDQVCMALEDFPHITRDCPITREIGGNEDRVWAQPFRAHSWHGRTHSESPGLVRSRTDDRTIAPPSHDDGLPAELWIVALPDGGIERIHVDMDYFSHSAFEAMLFDSLNDVKAYLADSVLSLL